MLKSNRRRFSTGRALKVVRRVHMYTGLFFFPWAMLFGLSGVLFNHPNAFEDVRGRRVATTELQEVTGLSPWQPGQIAERVVRELNRRGGERYELSTDYESELSGVSVFSAKAEQGRHVVLLEMQNATAIVATRSARPEPPPVPFAGARVVLPEVSLSHLQEKLGPLLASRNLSSQGELTAHPRISQQLRFRMLGADGTAYNTIYDLRTGALSGRRTDTWPSLGLSQYLGKLHTAHHFPARPGWMTVWAAMEDLLGLTLLAWGASGLVMWWQMRPTRRWGSLCVVATLAFVALAVWGTSSQLLFGPVAQALGPGG